MKILPIFVFFLLQSTPFHSIIENDKFSKTIILTGKVIDSSNGEPLTGVKVKILSQDQSVFTDFDGEFEIKLNREDNYTIQLEYISYVKKIVLGIQPDELPVIIMMNQDGNISLQKEELINPQT